MILLSTAAGAQDAGAPAPLVGNLEGRRFLVGGKAPPPISRIPQEYSLAKVQKLFELADRDHNKWISLRELAAALNVDRRDFLVFDSSQDGMVDFREFDAQVAKLIENGAVFPARGADTASAPASRPGNTATAASAPASTRPFRFSSGK